MSDGTDVQDKEEQELEAMKEQLEQLAEAEKAKAEQVAPSPEPAVSPAAEAPKPEESSVAKPEPEKPKGKDEDPLKWAEKKGFKSPEDMARALLQKEQEFHASRQKADPPAPQAPTPPAWQPRPEMYPQYPTQYPAYPQPQYRPDMVRQVAAMYPQLAPEDTEKILPVIFDVARVVSKQERDAYDKELAEIRRNTDRNNELMQLMQDPAFRDERVQREIHAIADSNPAIFQMGKGAYTHLFREALGSLARKQLQQGVSPEESPKPPVTAGGGNGSAFTVPQPVTEREFDSWSVDDQKAYINSKGRILPKKR